MPFARATDGTRLHYEVTGRRHGPPVLMIQGLGADKTGWNMQRLAFGPRYRVIAHDNRGAGRSDQPFGTYTLEQMAQDAITVLDAAGVDKAHVMGASMGGVIAQLVALNHPERVRSLTLACTACRNHEWRRELVTGWASTASERGMSAMTREAARWVIGPRSLRRLWPALGWLGPIRSPRASHGFVAQVRAILDADDTIARDLTQITVPALVVVGNQDVLTTRGDAEELAESIPTAELVVISGAAHGLMVEHASTYNRVVLDFLRRVHRAENHKMAPLADVATAS
jgi:3-oxoadipate enol-lactonase